MSWSLNTVLIQESVFETFIAKLKKNLSKLRIGKANDKQADITLPDWAFIDVSEKILDTAKQKGFDTYTAKKGLKDFGPSLIFGRKNQVLDDTDRTLQKDLNLYITSFRTINEAVALVNNEQLPIISASIWTEHIGTANEISKKLQVII